MPLPVPPYTVWTMLANSAIAVAYNIFVLSTVSRLERLGCPCARDWRLRFIHTFTIVKLAWVLLVLLLLAAMPALLQSRTFQILTTLFAIASIFNLIIALQYLTGLREKGCLCAASRAKTAWEVFLWLQVATLGVLLLSSVLMLVGIGQLREFGRQLRAVPEKVVSAVARRRPGSRVR